MMTRPPAKPEVKPVEPVAVDRGISAVDTIMAFAFGNRLSGGSTRFDGNAADAVVDSAARPGQVNEALAALTAELHQWSGAVLWAQWEIALVLESTLPFATDVLHSIGPVRGNDGELRYLSTRGVVAAVIEAVGGATALGRVAVVAHHDHVERCLRLCREASIDAVSAADVGAIGGPELSLPSFYDPDSGQPWTRNRVEYLRHEKKLSHEPATGHTDFGARRAR